jgi:hypothetical protein
MFGPREHSSVAALVIILFWRCQSRCGSWLEFEALTRSLQGAPDGRDRDGKRRTTSNRNQSSHASVSASRQRGRSEAARASEASDFVSIQDHFRTVRMLKDRREHPDHSRPMKSSTLSVCLRCLRTFTQGKPEWHDQRVRGVAPHQ